MNTLNELVSRIALLSPDDQALAIDNINNLLEETTLGTSSDKRLLDIRQTEMAKSKLHCLHCHSEDLIGYGFTPRGARRYRCKSCLLTFNEFTGTAVNSKRDLRKFSHYISCMLSGYSLRKCALEVGISLPTSFKWRHHILSSLEKAGQQQLEHIVELDETFFLYSEKGNKKIEGRKPRKRGEKASKDGMNEEHVGVLVASDRKGHNMINVASRGKLTKAVIHKTVGKKLSKKNTVVSDSDRNIAFYLRDREIEHIRLSARKKERVKDKIYHTQNVNNLQQRLKDWIKDYKGVSTKYLQNYLNLFQALNLIKTERHQLLPLISFIFTNKQLQT